MKDIKNELIEKYFNDLGLSQEGKENGLQIISMKIIYKIK